MTLGQYQAAGIDCPHCHEMHHWKDLGATHIGYYTVASGIKVDAWEWTCPNTKQVIYRDKINEDV